MILEVGSVRKGSVMIRWRKALRLIEENCNYEKLVLMTKHKGRIYRIINNYDEERVKEAKSGERVEEDYADNERSNENYEEGYEGQ